VSVGTPCQVLQWMH